jgi:hypothetical protein
MRIAIEQKWIKQILKNILLQLPLKPNYFKHIRHIYKLAEFRDDFEMLGALCASLKENRKCSGKRTMNMVILMYMSHP